MVTMAERLDLCEDFSGVFELVKKSAEQSLGQRRAGLMLYLAKLPKYIGAVPYNGYERDRDESNDPRHGYSWRSLS